MKLVGYIYEADHHCIACTLKRHATQPFALTDPLHLGPGLDENGLPYAATDSEGNSVYPLFDTEETEPIFCGDCHDDIIGGEK